MRDYALALKQRVRPLEQPYLVGLRDGSLIREDFVETQTQFLFAVVFFSRPMAVLTGRLPRPELRISLWENVHDEHGEGDLQFSHERTFLTLLERLGRPVEDIERTAMWPEVRAFNSALMGVCLFDDVYTALATLGMVEDLFAGISAAIGQGVLARQWLTKAELVHYATHEKLDVEHADGFYRHLHVPYREQPRHRYQIEQGLELGAHLLLQLYEGLWRARDRRWVRDVEGPHSDADGWHLERPGARSPRVVRSQQEEP